MTAPSITARLLSLAVLLLSVAPLGSIYVLFFSIVPAEFEDESSSSSSSLAPHHQQLPHHRGPGLPSFTRLLQDPNATMEELWTALLFHPWDPALLNYYYSSNKNSNSFVMPLYPSKTSLQHEHLRIALPWILSFLMGILLPLTISLILMLYGQQPQQEERRGPQPPHHQHHHYHTYPYPAGASPLPPARPPQWTSYSGQGKRLGRLQSQLQHFSKHLVLDDRIGHIDENDRPDDQHSDSTTGEEWLNECSSSSAQQYSWRLPRPGIPLPTRPNDSDDAPDTVTSITTSGECLSCRTVSGICPICLNAYAVGDSVVWSSNPYCQHHYHRNCIMPWLLRRNGTHQQQQLCPCCRQPFCELT